MKIKVGIKNWEFLKINRTLGPIYLKFPLSIKQKWEFFYEKWEFFKKEFPFILNWKLSGELKQELKWKLYVEILDKLDLIGYWCTQIFTIMLKRIMNCIQGQGSFCVKKLFISLKKYPLDVMQDISF